MLAQVCLWALQRQEQAAMPQLLVSTCRSRFCLNTNGDMRMSTEPPLPQPPPRLLLQHPCLALHLDHLPLPRNPGCVTCNGV